MPQFCQRVMVVACGLLAMATPSLMPGQQTSQYTAPHTAPLSISDTTTGRSDSGNASRDSQTRRIPTVTMNFDSVSREEALRAVVKAAGFDLVFSHDAVNLAGKVSARFMKTPLDSAVRELLRGTGIQAQLSLNVRSVLLAPANTPKRAAPQGGLRGQVLDSSTQIPLQFVVVSIEGTTLRAATDENGKFVFPSMEPGEYTVVIRRFGYQQVRRTLAITDGTPVDIRVALVPTATTLNTVVTTGAGDRPKYQVGNSIAVINADSIVANQPVINLSDLLANRAPGLQVLGTTGQAGAPSRLRIRGITSVISSNDPIIIIDGMRMNIGYSRCRQTEALTNCYSSASRLDDINPDIIESIDVLKGPAASTLYGSEAANGVIVIKTKRGIVGKTRSSMQFDYGSLFQPKTYPVPIQRLGQSPSVGDINTCTLLQEAYGNCNPIDSVVTYNFLRDPLTTSLARGHNSDINLNASGGSQTLQYFLSGGYSDVLGTSKLPSVNEAIYRRGGAPAIPNSVVRPNAERSTTANGRFTGALAPSLDFAVGANIMRRYQRLGADGMSGLVGGTFARTTGDTLTLVPGWERYFTRRHQNATHTVSNARLNWQPWQNIQTHATYGWDFSLRDDEELTPRQSCLPFCGDTTSDSYVGLLWTGRVTTVAHTVDMGGSVTTPIGSRWSLRSTIGTQYVRSNYRDVNIRARDLGFRNGLSGATGEKFVQELGSDYATLGAYLDELVSLNDRFFFGAAIRRDYASSLGPQAPLPLFPKWSMSWVISQENFFPWKDQVNLRLRAGFGHAGTQPQATARFQLYNTTNGFVSVNGVDTANGLLYGYIASIGNVAVKPERTIEREGGFDLGLFRDRVNLDVTFYRKFTRDALYDLPLPSSLGLGNSFSVGKQTQNIGNVLNSGTELTLNARLLNLDMASWNVTLGYASRRNRLITLGPDFKAYSTADGFVQTPGDNADARLAVGYPLFGRWARPVVSFNDANNDGIIVPAEVRIGDSLVYIGPSEAKYDLGIHNDISLLDNRVRVSASFQYVHGLVQLNDFAYQNAQWLAYAQFKDVGSLEDQAYLAAASLPLGQQSVYGFYERASYLRFTTLSLGYTLPPHIVRLARARTANVMLQGTNLALWSNYRGKDPAINTADVSGNRYFNGSAFPAPRMFSLRFNLAY